MVNISGKNVIHAMEPEELLNLKDTAPVVEQNWKVLRTVLHVEVRVKKQNHAAYGVFDRSYFVKKHQCNLF